MDEGYAEMNMLEVDNLSQSYGGMEVLHDVSFSIEAGEKVGLIGPNGAGKTTLINVINGILPPKRGNIYFAGKEITHLAAYNRASLGMARSSSKYALPSTYCNYQCFASDGRHERCSIANVPANFKSEK